MPGSKNDPVPCLCFPQFGPQLDDLQALSTCDCFGACLIWVTSFWIPSIHLKSLSCCWVYPPHLFNNIPNASPFRWFWCRNWTCHYYGAAHSESLHRSWTGLLDEISWWIYERRNHPTPRKEPRSNGLGIVCTTSILLNSNLMDPANLIFCLSMRYVDLLIHLN